MATEAKGGGRSLQPHRRHFGAFGFSSRFVGSSITCWPRISLGLLATHASFEALYAYSCGRDGSGVWYYVIMGSVTVAA